MKPGSIEAFLKSQFATARHGGAIVRIVVTHQPLSGRLGAEVFSIDKPPADVGDDWIECTAEQCRQAANDDAAGVSGPQLYCVGIHREKSPDVRVGRYRFRVAGGADDDQTEDTEPPTDKGLTQAAMRHAEVVFRLLTETVSAMHKNMAAQIESQGKQIEGLQTKQSEAVDMIEAVMTARQEHELQLLREKNRAELLTGVGKDVKALLPVVVRKLGGELPEGTPSDSQIAAQKFFESLSDEQKAKIAGELTPAQQIALMELFQGGADN